MPMIRSAAGCVAVPLEAVVVERGSWQAPPEVDRTLYLSESGTYTKLAGGPVGYGPDSNDMLSVAVKVRLDTAKNIKVSHPTSSHMRHSRS